jgi:hypothetical protein
VHRDHRQERGAEVAGSETDAGEQGAYGATWLERNLPAVAADGVALGIFDAFERYLDALKRSVHASDSAAGD